MFSDLVELLLSQGAVTEQGTRISLPDWAPTLSAAEMQQAEAYLATLRESPYAPPAENRPARHLFSYLVDTGAVVDVGNGVAFAGEAYAAMVEKIVAALREKPTISLAEVRDLFGTSRRFAQPLLEHLDSKRITLRRGDEHVLGPAAAQAVSRDGGA